MAAADPIFHATLTTTEASTLEKDDGQASSRSSQGIQQQHCEGAFLFSDNDPDGTQSAAAAAAVTAMDTVPDSSDEQHSSGQAGMRLAEATLDFESFDDDSDIERARITTATTTTAIASRSNSLEQRAYKQAVSSSEPATVDPKAIFGAPAIVLPTMTTASTVSPMANVLQPLPLSAGSSGSSRSPRASMATTIAVPSMPEEDDDAENASGSARGGAENKPAEKKRSIPVLLVTTSEPEHDDQNHVPLKRAERPRAKPRAARKREEEEEQLRKRRASATDRPGGEKSAALDARTSNILERPPSNPDLESDDEVSIKRAGSSNASSSSSSKGKTSSHDTSSTTSAQPGESSSKGALTASERVKTNSRKTAQSKKRMLIDSEKDKNDSDASTSGLSDGDEGAGWHDSKLMKEIARINSREEEADEDFDAKKGGRKMRDKWTARSKQDGPSRRNSRKEGSTAAPKFEEQSGRKRGKDASKASVDNEIDDDEDQDSSVEVQSKPTAKTDGEVKKMRQSLRQASTMKDDKQTLSRSKITLHLPAEDSSEDDIRGSSTKDPRKGTASSSRRDSKEMRIPSLPPSTKASKSSGKVKPLSKKPQHVPDTTDDDEADLPQSERMQPLRGGATTRRADAAQSPSAAATTSVLQVSARRNSRGAAAPPTEDVTRTPMRPATEARSTRSSSRRQTARVEVVVPAKKFPKGGVLSSAEIAKMASEGASRHTDKAASNDRMDPPSEDKKRSPTRDDSLSSPAAGRATAKQKGRDTTKSKQVVDSEGDEDASERESSDASEADAEEVPKSKSARSTEKAPANKAPASKTDSTAAVKSTAVDGKSASNEEEDIKPKALTVKDKNASSALSNGGAAKEPVKRRGLAGTISKLGMGGGGLGVRTSGLSRKHRVPSLLQNRGVPPAKRPPLPPAPVKKPKRGEEIYSDEDQEEKRDVPEEWWEADDYAAWEDRKRKRAKARGDIDSDDEKDLKKRKITLKLSTEDMLPIVANEDNDISGGAVAEDYVSD